MSGGLIVSAVPWTASRGGPELGMANCAANGSSAPDRIIAAPIRGSRCRGS